MNEAELEAYFADCVATLQARNKLLETKHGIGHFARWDHDGEAGTLTFSDPGGDRVVAATTTLGSYSLKTNTWLWGWANESNTPADRERSSAFQKLADQTRLRLFRESHINCDEFLAWELAAAAARHLDAAGIYRGPSGHLWVFWSIDRIVTEKI